MLSGQHRLLLTQITRRTRMPCESVIGTSISPSTINYQPSTLFALPVVIDMTRRLAFIKLNPSLFIFHRFEKGHSLTLAHLAFFLRFGLGHLLIFVCWFLRFVLASPFNFTGKFLLRRFLRRRGRRRILLPAFTLSRRWRRRFIFSF